MDFEKVMAVGMGMAGVEESTYYGDPCLKREGKVMCTLRPEGEVIGIRLDWEMHDRVLEEYPEVFFKTDHLDGWPWVRGRMEAMSEAILREVLAASWEVALVKIKNRPKGFAGR